MDTADTLALELRNDGRGTCDRGNCTRDPTNSYKGDRLCDQHFQQFMAMRHG
ncbi:hypothetical protein SAMN04489841_1433 [Natrinema salaciae]|uniref:Uncharacterized protein n=1 Tax=Natrinema salaciae TaxID=1186196 RepID=A0A1H9F0M1_9EURY|nr:hypothetical protein SAMN04489841_1433 [Natrinema salaciae]